jgi:hypothetical protein
MPSQRDSPKAAENHNQQIMELSAYEVALVSGGLGIVGVLAGVLISYRLTLKTAKNSGSTLAAQTWQPTIRLAANINLEDGRQLAHACRREQASDRLK